MTAYAHRAIHERSPVRGIELVTIASNHVFPRHSHDQFGIGVIRSGAHRSWSGIGMVEASQGDVIMVNPGEIHDGKPLDKQIRVWQMIYFTSELATDELRSESISSFELIHPATRDPQLARAFDGLFDVLTTSGADELLREEALTHLLSQLLSRHTSAKRADTRAPSLTQARELLEGEPGVRVSLAELASACGLSKFQFLRAFSTAFGITPHAYQMQRRTSRAKALLAGGMSPAQAAIHAGFADQSHLTRCFARQFGLTPGRYVAAMR
jgi:AraC-like DNA-binding protein